MGGLFAATVRGALPVFVNVAVMDAVVTPTVLVNVNDWVIVPE
jgi:hypothetical protein